MNGPIPVPVGYQRIPTDFRTAAFDNRFRSPLLAHDPVAYLNGLLDLHLYNHLAPENLEIVGRGIFLMRTFMDEVRFRNINFGTEITLIKRLQGNDLDRQEAST
ncbi:MAG: hypothetical protein ACHP8B_15950 [Terriglobales bacterium]